MQTTLKATNGPNACRQCKAKLPKGHYKIRCDPCLEKQRVGAAQTRRKRKFKELENVSPGGQETVKKSDIAKVCVNTWSYMGGDVISNSPKSAEMEFASFDDLISEVKLAFQVPSSVKGVLTYILFELIRSYLYQSPAKRTHEII